MTEPLSTTSTGEDLAALARNAEQTIRGAQQTADADTGRPAFHFRAPGQWMDDPNGIIFHEGVYHVMYSLNPASAEHRAGMVYKTAVRKWDPTSPDWTGGITVWGHATSTDLIHWSHEPVAIYPDVEQGEHFIWFGGTVINDDGDAVAVYTAIGPDMRPEDTAETWAAISTDPNLVEWAHVPNNPIVTSDVHNGIEIGEWRDPYIFREGGNAYMLLGGRHIEGDTGTPVVLLYQAKNTAFTEWDYRGILFRDESAEYPSAECPNLVRVGDEWLLIISPHGPVRWWVGDVDFEACSFTPRADGYLDRSSNYYATNILHDGKSEPLVWAAIEGFSDTSGWNGALSLPRRLSLKDGVLVQEPFAELESLRRDVGDITVGGAPVGVAEASCELSLTFERLAGADVTIRFEGEGRTVEVILGVDEVVIDGRTFPVDASEAASARVFLDRSVIDVFLGAGECITAVIPAIPGTVDVSVASASDSTATADIWHLDASNLFTDSPRRTQVLGS